MVNLVKVVGLPLLTGMLLFSGCNNTLPDKSQDKKPTFETTWVSPEVIQRLNYYKGIMTREINPGDRYLDYAKEIQKKYPDLKIRKDEIAEYLRIINGGMLIAGKKAVIPVYAKSK